MKTIFEPFRIKSVEPIRMTTREERRRLIRQANYNPFTLHSDDVMIDLLTDSGTGAMSAAQWSAVMRGDESYAGSPSFYRFEAAVKNLMNFKHIIPTHQGRAAEAILFSILGGPGRRIPSNTHFDTTRGNIEARLHVGITTDTRGRSEGAAAGSFKGNMDLDALREAIAQHRDRIPFVMMTVTNNGGGGQPVSMANLKEASEITRAAGIPFYIDACRFAENAYFVRAREKGYENKSLIDIAREMFALADGCTMSAKKDGMANIGGSVAVRDEELATRLRQALVMTEGFPTYGGMSGRDLDAIAQGLQEVVDENYLEYRHASIAYVCDRLHERGIPVLMPPGGHAIFLDAARYLDHLPWQEYPGQALAMELYLEGGIRSCEIGTLMLGRTDPVTGEELPAQMELVRLAIPRRTYTQSHMDYLLEVIEAAWVNRDSIGGVEVVDAPPVLRHFTGKYRCMPRKTSAV